MGLEEKYYLTAKGKELLREASPVLRPEVGEFLEGLEARTGPDRLTFPETVVQELLRHGYIGRMEEFNR